MITDLINGYVDNVIIRKSRHLHCTAKLKVTSAEINLILSDCIKLKLEFFFLQKLAFAFNLLALFINFLCQESLQMLE